MARNVARPARCLASMAFLSSLLCLSHTAMAGTIRLNLRVSGRIFAVAPSCKSASQPPSTDPSVAEEEQTPSMCLFLANPFSIPTIEIEEPTGCSKSGESLGGENFTLFMNDQPYDPRTSNVGSQLQLFQLRYGLDLNVTDESLVCERTGILRIRY